jgi:hypothetical protein
MKMILRNFFLNLVKRVSFKRIYHAIPIKKNDALHEIRAFDIQ